jgi:FAD-linked oxidoreductase
MVTWKNWGGNQTCSPLDFETPSTEEEIVVAVKQAAASGRRVKVVGSGHSFTDAACTDGSMISLSRYNRVLKIDAETRRVNVEAGITFGRLSEVLAASGLAMENLGDIDYQSVAGAMSTATHGTGARLGNLSTQIHSLTMVTADGSVVSCSADEDPEVFKAAQVSIGALGVISTVTLRCVDAFNLEGFSESRPLEDTLGSLEQMVEGHDHFEFFWFPHTDRVQVKLNQRTLAPAKPKGPAEQWIDQILMENHVFGTVCRLGKMRQEWIPRLNRFVVSQVRSSKRVDRSDRIFTTPRLVRFVEMEYAIPRGAAEEAVRAVQGVIDKQNLRISFPVEVRFVAADDIYLSPSFGRDTAYVAVHVFQGMEFESYFRGVEEAMKALGGRPHWGKMHYRTAADLAPDYPEWERFQAVRDRLDLERVFANAYTERVLGP